MPRNVFIELGIAIALNRPTLLLRHKSNKEAGLELPKCLQCLSEQILEFSGNHSLKKVLLENLPKWVNKLPEKAWWNRHCIFGGRVCEHRETHPRAKHLGQDTLSCIIADGADSSRPDFREIVEDVLGRFSDVTYTYLDALSLEKGYSFLLCTYCQKVRSSSFAIHRITLKTPPEAFIAIGMSLALETQFEYKIPKILITEDIQNVPSLLSGYEVVVAKSDKDKKDKLRKFMPIVIKKVKETTWKPKPLPFIDISVNNDFDFSGDINLSDQQRKKLREAQRKELREAQQRKKLREAIIGAYPSRAKLEMMVSVELNENLDAIAGRGNLQEIVFNLVLFFHSQGRLKQLIEAAYKDNPRNIKLKAIREELYEIEEIVNSEINDFDFSRDINLSGQEYEKLLDAIIDAYPVRARLKQMIRFKFNENLDQITNSGSFSNDVFNLIEYFDSQGRLMQLIQAAYQYNPGNKKLRTIWEELYRENEQ